MVSSRAARAAGRRPGTSSTREAIASAAREQFAQRGYRATTIRSVAAEAGVDPSLVIHFYGSKDALFRSVMELPADLADRLAAVAEGDRATVGARLAALLTGVAEAPATRAVLIGRIRAAAAEPDAARLVHDLVTRDLARLATAITDDRPDLRAALVGSQLVGLAFAREIVGVEALGSRSSRELAALLAPGLQRLLTEPLD